MACCMAVLQIVLVLRRVFALFTQRVRPVIRDRRQYGVEPPPQRRHMARQRVAQVLVLAAAEVMSLHDDPRAEMAFIRVKRTQRFAVIRIEQGGQYCETIAVQLAAQCFGVNAAHGWVARSARS